MRLFVAVVPPAPVRAHLELALEAVRGAGPLAAGRGGLRWSPPEDRHLTLGFYGPVPAGAGEEIGVELATIAAAHEPFEIRLRGAGVFDRRTLWIGCGGDVGALAALASACVELGEAVTGRVDQRVRSRSHLTVARATNQSRGRIPGHRGPGRDGPNRDGPGERDELATIAHALAVYEGPTWTLDSIVLVSSRPGEGKSGGPAYDVVRTYPLGGFGEEPSGGRSVPAPGERL